MKTRILPFALILCITATCFSQVWSPQAAGTLPSNFSVMNVSIVSDQVAWAIALDYNQWGFPIPSTHILKVLRTTDGGANWSVKDFTQAPGRMTYGIFALDENTALFSATNFQNIKELFRTSNGGDSWTQVLTGPAAEGRPIFFNMQEGVAVLPGYGIARTTDGGLNWTSLSPSVNYPPFLSGEDHLNVPTGWDILGDTLWVGTTKGRIYRSTDRGQNWTVHQATTSNTYIGSIAFSDSKNGLVLIGNWNNPPLKLIKTVDGGANWVEIGNSNNLTEVLAIPCTNSFMGVAYFDNTTFFSKDLGASWELLSNTITPAGPAFLTPEIGWITNGGVTGTNPAIYKWDGSPLTGRTFVNQNANGANNGSSWEDAYTDLKVALDSAEAGDEIWVAEGTYLPGADPAATFLIDKNLKLYGGFVGSECNLSERDIVLHPTVLSGDLEGDDVLDDFVTNRGDNVMTVMTMTAAVTNEMVVDGFTIRNGHADGSQDNQQRNGGAVYSSGSPHFRQCSFRQNYALNSGGAIRQNASTSPGIQVENCQFEKNKANYGGGFYLTGGSFFIKETDFIENATFDGQLQANGGGLWVVNSSGTIESCLFENNYAFEYGGGLHVWNPQGTSNSTVEILDCTFENNRADAGLGGLSLLSFGNNTTYLLKSSAFKSNSSPAGGGAGINCNPASNNAKFFVEDCSFSMNEADDGAPAIWSVLRGKNLVVEVNNCEFTSNNSPNGEGIASFWGTEGGTGTALIDSCIFENNSTFFASGLEIGNGWNGGASVSYTATNCIFRNNTAAEDGALLLWCRDNSNTNILVEDCEFDGNEATVRGGAIGLFPDGENFNVRLNRVTVTNNQSPIGGAIDCYNFFQVAFPSQTSLLIENSLIANNMSLGSAAINLDSIKNFSLLNCTVADNSGGGIQVSNQSALTLQNTVLANPGHTEYTTSTNSTVTSNGGNLVLDNSLNASLTVQDKPETEPGFEPGTYEPSSTSPLINAGVNAGVTALFDLTGNPRIQHDIVDIGAYESPFPTAAREVIIGEVELSPNPATDFVQLHLPESITQPNEISFFDTQGRLVEQRPFTPGQHVQVGHLPGGIYTLRLTDGERVYVGKFIKQ